MAVAVGVVFVIATGAGAWAGYFVARRLAISEAPSFGIGPRLALFWTWLLRIFSFLVVMAGVTTLFFPILFLLNAILD